MDSRDNREAQGWLRDTGPYERVRRRKRRTTGCLRLRVDGIRQPITSRLTFAMKWGYILTEVILLYFKVFFIYLAYAGARVFTAAKKVSNLRLTTGFATT